jgi:hypothetical protein
MLVLLSAMLLNFSPSVFAAPDDRQVRREERGRSDERQDRRDCRQDEGRAGSDKRECKQEEVRDGRGGDDASDKGGGGDDTKED